jgi:hypothetical protein
LKLSVADLVCGLDPRVDWVDHADEDPLSGLRVVADHGQHAARVLLAGELDVEVARVQLQQARQQLAVWDIEAVGRVLVGSRAGVDADALALVVAEALERAVVERDELAEQLLARVELQRQPAPSVKSCCTL